MKRRGVTIRSMSLLVVALSLMLGWWKDHRRVDIEVRKLQDERLAIRDDYKKHMSAYLPLLTDKRGFALGWRDTIRALYPWAVAQPLPHSAHQFSNSADPKEWRIVVSPEINARLLGSGPTEDAAWKAAVRNLVKESTQ